MRGDGDESARGARECADIESARDGEKCAGYKCADVEVR